MTLSEVFPTIVIIINALSFLLSFLCIVGYIRAAEKTTAAKMIFILNIFMMLLPFIDALRNLIQPQGVLKDLFESIDFTCFEFSIFWMSSFAIFTYKTAKDFTSHFNEDRFFKSHLTTCLLLSGGYFLMGLYKPFDIYAYNDALGFTTYDYIPDKPLNNFFIFVVFELVGKSIPAILATARYIRVYRMAKDDVFDLNLTQKRIIKIILMAVIPIVCFVPLSITDIVLMVLKQSDPPELSCVRYILIWVFLFVNLLNYWFLLPKVEVESDLHVSMQKINV